MARSKKSPKDTAKSEGAPETVVTDAVDAVQTETGDGDPKTPDIENSPSPVPEPELADVSETSEAEAKIPAPEDESKDTLAEESVDEKEVVAEAEGSTDTPNLIEPQAIVQKRGFVPMLLGGVVCVGLGYAGANFIKPDGWPFPGASTDVLQARVSALETQLADSQTQAVQMAELIDTVRGEMSAVTTSVDAKIADINLNDALAPVEAALAAVDQRLTAVEAAPVAEAIVSPEATAAYERQLTEMQTLLNSEVARLQDAKAAAENEEANAAKASAISRLQEAITTGQPYDAVLRDLQIDVPAALSVPAVQGVATLQDIAISFGEAADIAIVETAKTDGESQGWMDRFLRTQLGLRSLTPKDGTSPDAVLSRAEQAVRDNDLQAALTEISTLPDVGQAVMADWVAMAQTRLDVTNALSAMLAQ
ncbi:MULTISPECIES: COG4223 family protein [Pacificibacter]|uniref:COG4223 family protein n=1 Tax=Pacificibacter TaxID=1042323 RepID=UPI001C08FBCD|nr:MULTISPECIES: hypothetical protein [Pacificibacter]MBU2936182.1 hypothetical protein [Pacificibacter marinus]MDO6614968.1 hypothetical protein [Pacificibacter sp. 1_MG-2023]